MAGNARCYITKAKGGLFTLSIRVDGHKVWAGENSFQDKHQYASDARAEFSRWKAANGFGGTGDES